MKKKITLTTFVLLWVSQMMAVDYTINVQSEGCNAVAYTLPSGAVGQIQATANTGSHFTQWSDGNTDNPRTITVTGNKTYTAQFAPEYTIGVKANGCDLYYHQIEEGKQLVIKAVADVGYKFVQWNDGSTQNPRTITVTGDKTYTATFEGVPYTITAKSANNLMGTVSGSGTYNVNTTVTLTATPKSGYKFVQWNDGSTQNPRTITVTGDKTYTATFEGVPYTITAKSANNLMGTVSGSGTYVYNTNATLTATPKSGYKFVQWNDGSTQNPRTITVTGDKTYTATFEGAPYTITAKSANNLMGTVSGSGTYVYNTNATLTATPNAGYEFVRWNDGNIDNPRMVKIMQDTVFIATFRAKPIVTVAPNYAEMGSVSGGGTYATGSTASLTATPNEGYEFVRWNDGNTDNPRMVRVTGDNTYIAVFGLRSYTVTLKQNFTLMGDVEGGGTYEYNTMAGIFAAPKAGYHFVQWNDGNTDNPRYVKVTGDATYTAEFAVGASQEESHGATVNNDGVSVTPYETKADFVWPSITGVASYSLIIWADEAQGKKVCTLTFNANGQLTNIDFTQSVKPQGESVEGLNFTVTGLKPGTTYGYTLDAKDAEDDVIETKNGTFTTMGADGIADIIAAGINIYTEGRTIIVENATDAITVSDALGRVVGKDDAHIVPAEIRKFPVPSSGVYVVKIGNRVASVLVR